jgi:hypothetical protein
MAMVYDTHETDMSTTAEQKKIDHESTRKFKRKQKQKCRLGIQLP